MVEIADYTVVADSDLSGFIDAVKEHVRLGWKPQGGVAVCVIGIGFSPGVHRVYYQAMVKPGREEK